MKKKIKNMCKYMLMLLIMIVFNQTFLLAQTKGLKKAISLEGLWSFSIGSDSDWIDENYDDSDWEKIRVPSPWEDEGFHGYNGHAFYRKRTYISEDYKGQMLYLVLGYIDDVDEVYFNGQKIGSTGTFPPGYHTAYNAHRKYYIPEELVKFNRRNLIVVKVYDSQQEGGIVSGDVGIYTSSFGLRMDVNLQGSWKFRTGDNFDWKSTSYNDAGWDNVFVPSKWEDQGYKRYDGYAWYRKKFKYTSKSDDKMVVVVGKIDDADQVYINGVLVGTTGNMPKIEGKRFGTGQEYRAFRGYYFPAKLLKDGLNTIAIRVYDGQGDGGIYEGPVGIVSQKKYIEYWRNRKKEHKWNDW
jgi:sialate O-acetylesterase